MFFVPTTVFMYIHVLYNSISLFSSFPAHRDDAAAVSSCTGSAEDLELCSNVLVLADQLLIPRLIQICERQLAAMLTLKNAAEVLQVRTQAEGN